MLLSTDEYLTLLKARLAQHRVKARSSSSGGGSNKRVDSHLAKYLLSKRRGFFRPTPVEVTRQMTNALLKPLPLLMIFFIIICIERSSDANIENQDGEIITKRNKELIDESNDSILDTFTPFIFSGESSTTEDEAMITFISGIISVYLPKASDAGGIAKDIVAAARRAEVDPLYVASVISVESRFSKTARSHVGALGLMQLMPKTATELAHGIAGKKAKPRLFDRKTNLRLGIRYLKTLHRKYNGNQRYVLAAYNWGMGKVDKHRRGKAKMPKDVARYATTIISRNQAWRKHFKSAKEGAALYTESKS